jgi:protein-S-isoprenylcysteine O-methyltransferase Ste14
MPSWKAALLYSIMAIAVAVIFAAFSHLPWTGRRIAGAALAVPSFILWLLSRIQLGSSFSIRPQAKGLVTQGLYSKIRNPVYVFGSIFIAGIILYSGQPVFLLIFAVIIPMQVIRARKEANVLEAAFGDAYREYRKKTWF